MTRLHFVIGTFIAALLVNLSPAHAQNAASDPSPSIQYALSLVHAVERNLRYPKGSAGQECIALVTQNQAGEVTSMKIESCGSKKLRKAVEAAIWKASPFPLPTDPSAFEARLNLHFIVPTGQ